MIKMIYTGTKMPDQSAKEFRTYYLESHAPLFMQYAPQAREYTINFPNRFPG